MCNNFEQFGTIQNVIEIISKQFETILDNLEC